MAFSDGRLQVGQPPLEGSVVGNAEGADLAVAPRLLRDPFGDVVGVQRFLVGTRLRGAGGFAGAARVHPHQCVAAWTPPLGIRRLPGHVRVRLFLQIVRRNPYLVLLVWADVHDCRTVLIREIRAEHVGVEQGAVAQRNLHVLLDDQFARTALRHLLGLLGHGPSLMIGAGDPLTGSGCGSDTGRIMATDDKKYRPVTCALSVRVRGTDTISLPHCLLRTGKVF